MIPNLVEILVRLFWLSAIFIPPYIKAVSHITGGRFMALMTWGKNLDATDKSVFLVPHRYFAFFYVSGFFFNILGLLELTLEVGIIPELVSKSEAIFVPLLSLMSPRLAQRIVPFEWDSSQPLLPSVLLQVQLTRRLLESFFLVKNDNSKMHVAHLIFALCYYPALTLSLNIGYSSITTRAIAVGSVWLFLWASSHQYSCHAILASLRQEGQKYGLPRGDWFELVSSPHYFCEMLIYIAIYVSSGFNILMGLNCVYQLVNFALICTPPTHAWYLKKFDDYPKERRILIPYLY